MRKLLATTITVALLTTGAAAAAAAGTPSAAPPPQGPIAVTFTDVGPGDPFFYEIEEMAFNDIMAGYPDGTFRPRNAVTREAMAAFLYRYFAGPAIPTCGMGPRVFSDVPASHPFCAAIEWLFSQGIATGWPDGTFRPGEPVSREATAAFLYRALAPTPTIPACGAEPRTFTDVPATHPFCGAIEWLTDVSIVGGWPDHTFRPSLSVERQAMAAFLSRIAV